MDLTPIDDVVRRLRALSLTLAVTGQSGTLYGSLLTTDLERLEKLRADLEAVLEGLETPA